MKDKLMALMDAIIDHTNDSEKDYEHAKHMKSLGDNNLAEYFISCAKNRIEMAGKALDKFDYLLRDYENKEAREGKDKEVTKEKIETWHCVRKMLEEKIKEESRELSSF